MENNELQEKIKEHRKHEVFNQEILEIVREGQKSRKSIKQVILELTRAFLPYTDDIDE